MRIDWYTVGRCVTRAQQHLDPDVDKRRLDGLIRIGVDDTSYRKGHKYMTVVINHDYTKTMGRPSLRSSFRL